MSTTTTPIDRAAINRRNAQKSTGPRTSEGKSRSRFNAVKHGMSAKTLVLPGEDADVLQQRIEAWTSDLQPQNEVEQFLVERSVQFSWQLERADRAELARLSSLIHGVPAAAASRQQEEAAALGRRLLSGRNVTQEANFQSQILSLLVPGRKSQPAQSVDVLEHPEAIVMRLESTAAGCRWMLDRWAELRAILDQGQNWQLEEKVKAIRLQGMRPSNCETGEWESRVRIFKELQSPRSIAIFEREIAVQLDPQVPEGQAVAPSAFLKLVERMTARLETLAAEHRERAEAEAAQQVALLSFDPGNEGERLRRYQSSCSRSLFRSFDMLIKLRRSSSSGSAERGGACGEFDRGDQPEATETGIPRFTVDTAETNTERGDEGKDDFEPPVEAAGIVETTTENEPTSATTDHWNPRHEHTQRSVSPSVDHGNGENEPMSSASDHPNRQNEPTAPPVAEIARPRLPLHRDVVSAMILVVLFVAWLWTMPALLSASPQKRLRIEPGGSAGGAGSTPATQVLGCNTSRNLQNEATN